MSDTEIDVNKVLVKKISGLIMSIELMSDQDKSSLPSEDYGMEINRIIGVAINTHPELQNYIPTNVTFIEKKAINKKLTGTSWIEIHAKLKQLQELLEE